MRLPPKYAKPAKRAEELEMLVCPPKQRKTLTIVVGVDRDENINTAKAHALDRHLRACPEDPKTSRTMIGP